MKYTRSGNSTYLIVLIALLFCISCSKKETPTPKPPTPTNTSPVASFTVSPASGDVNTVFAFDASICSDKETSMASLQVRWDFNNDGTFDTNWSTTKTESGSFTSAGTYITKLEVKDAGGLISSTTKSISVESGAFTDTRDGKVYTTITIDGITWMDDNMAYEIPGKQITDASVWAGNSSYDGWCYYDNDKDSYGDLYGILYQFEAAIAAIPDGWHLPTELEIRAITESLGGASVAGGKLKEEGTVHWNAPNTGATNSSGYTALPSGYRDENGVFSDLGDYGAYWTSTIYTLLDAWFWFLSYDDSAVSWFTYPKKRGFAVRCVKDQDNNTAPSASFSVSPASGDVNTSFVFDASGSSDNESTDSDLYVRWDFDNDGTFDTEWSTTKTVSHTYTAKGTYTAKVEVEDEGGLVGSTTKTIVVSDAATANTAPTASFTISPTSGDTNTSFAFDASASSDTETATADLLVRWDFDNDGTFEVDWTTTKTTTHTYSSAATYTVKVELKDEGNLVSSDTKTVVVDAIVANTAPSASLTVDPTSGDTNTGFYFDASGSSDTETATADLQVRWDVYNDGSYESDWTTDKLMNLTFSNAGTYTIKVEVKDEGGLITSATVTIVVTAIVLNTVPTASFTISPGSGDTDTNFAFDASASSDTETTSTNLKVRWDFDNNGTFEVDWTTAKTTTHTYSSVATYTVKMEVKDEGELVSSDTKTVIVDAVANTSPTASFTSSKDLEYINTSIFFDASATSDAETALGDIEVRWDFDNNGTFEVDWTTTKTTTYSYTIGGDLTAKLEVRDEGGLVSSATKSIQIETGILMDTRDNNAYTTVIIDDKIWLADNLRYEISGKEITNNSTWSNNNTYDGWRYFDNDKTTYSAYGVLYQWEAAKIACPSGWHLPSDDEWKTLEIFLGMSQSVADERGYRGTDEGKKLKSTSGWYSGGNGTNVYGFDANGGGYGYSDGRFTSPFYQSAGFWSSSQYLSYSTDAIVRFLHAGEDKINSNYYSNRSGLSVRCLKD